MAPTPSKLRKSTAHATACQLICAACFRRVPCVLDKDGKERVPDRDGSRRLNRYLCDLALTRWEVIWDYTQRSADAISPLRICTTCRIALIMGRPKFSEAKVSHPTRQHTERGAWRPGECPICDAAFAAGRPKKGPKGRPSTAGQGFITVCKSCMGERAKGRSHKCGRKSALSNSLQLLNESFTSPQQVAHKCIRAGVNKSSQFSLHGQTGGSPTEINVGKPSAPTVSVTADDMLHQHSAFHFSSRRNIKNARAWKARIEKSGCKVSLPSFFFLFCVY